MKNVRTSVVALLAFERSASSRGTRRSARCDERASVAALAYSSAFRALVRLRIIALGRPSFLFGIGDGRPLDLFVSVVVARMLALAHTHI